MQRMTPLALHASGCDELHETKADQLADRTAHGKDGETNVHSRVAAISYHVGLQGKASKTPCVSRGTCMAVSKRPEYNNSRPRRVS